MDDDTQNQQQQPLLQTPQHKPNGSRLLQGLIDVVMLALGLLLFAISRVFRLLVKMAGLEQKKTRTFAAKQLKTRAVGTEMGVQSRGVNLGESVEQREVVEDDDELSSRGEDEEVEAALAACRSGVLSMFVTKESEKEVWVSELDSSDSAREVVLMLKGCHAAYLHCLKHHSLMEQDMGSTQLQEKVAKVLSDVLSDPSRSYSAAAQKLSSIYVSAVKQAASKASSNNQSLDIQYILKEYQFYQLMHRTRHIPSRMQRVVMSLQGSRFLEEVVENLDISVAFEYLGILGGRYTEYVDFMQQFGNLRPSGAKKQTQVQAITMNGRYHSARVQDEDGTSRDVYGDIRCGAFTLHGRKPSGNGLSALQDALETCAQGTSPESANELAKKLHFTDFEHLKQEVADREVLLTAQALVVVAQALSLALKSTRSLAAAWRSGSFLLLQQSMLSDLHASERAMLQDMEGVLRLINQRVRVRFDLNPPAHMLEVDQEHITLCFDANKLLALRDVELQAETFTLLCTPGEFAQRTYGVTWLLANQGVNVWQSLGFLYCGDRTELLQDKLNAAAFAGLQQYAARIGCEEVLEALKRHFSEEGSRSAKDLEVVRLMREAVVELGGLRVVNCKSGKDRTAMEVATAMAWETVRQGYAPPGSQHIIHDKFVSGLSYAMTSQNNGKPNAYAFSEPELMTLPSGWGPDWKLCANVES